MSSPTLNFSYFLAIIIGLLAAYFMNNASPNLNPVVKFFVVPIIIIYIMLKIGYLKKKTMAIINSYTLRNFN